LRQRNMELRQALEDIRRMADDAVGHTQRPHIMPALAAAHDIRDMAAGALRRDGEMFRAEAGRQARTPE
jgi:hypothetical protein